ncbi:hypothetical protein LCM20_06480 [Halobacillus litoralis]|uniref:hypothetical protein n=1 Tax=Halobacillus litoralis TaxID=45668 RepID=UPI001CD34B53|nr:hypothetical protein [Halobacillus litoralis]MCA0970227.1 hypothetical protein [Halobacillus litoralis]
MRKTLIPIVVILLICAGCTNRIEAGSTFDKKKVTEDIKGLTMNVKLPTLVPFETFKIMSESSSDNRAESYTLNLFAKPEDKEALSITAVEGNLSPPEETEKVELSEGKVGYFSEQGDIAVMVWEDEDVSYHVQHICEDNRKLFSKNGFVQFVNQFN